MKVLFVCKGNVGRSQMAKSFFSSLAPEDWTVESAGTEVLEHEGQLVGELPAAAEVIAVMKESGFDLSSNKRTQVTPEMLEEFDRIVVTVERTVAPEFLVLNQKAEFWDVQDPFKRSLEFTRNVRDEIRRLVDDLVRHGQE
jgi:protein-tyrosine-phosphatase